MADQKNRHAAALRYGPEQPAPTLVAKGQGDFAEQIVAMACEHGVPIHQDPALVEVLSRLNLDDQIPPQLFEVVAVVLGFIYRLQDEQESSRCAPEQG